MIQTVCDKLKARLSGLDVTERLAGLVQPARVKKSTGIFVYPSARDTIGVECWEGGKYNELLPNSEYKSVLYMEQRSDLTIDLEAHGRAAGMTRWRSEIR